MKNLKHIHKRRVHLERAQPSTRKHRGLLEKHKDYVKRARSYNKKQDTLKKLHEKAYFKNPDEFNFKMNSSKMVDGQLKKKEKPQLSNDEQRLLESQDARYVGMRRQADLRATERKLGNLHFLGVEQPKSHTVFVDEDDLAGENLKGFDLARHLDTHPSLLGRTENRPRLSQLEKMEFGAGSRSVQKATRHAYVELRQQKKRAKKLTRVLSHLELRNNLRSKGKRRKVTEGKKDGPTTQYKWFRERKR